LRPGLAERSDLVDLLLAGGAGPDRRRTGRSL